MRWLRSKLNGPVGLAWLITLSVATGAGLVLTTTSPPRPQSQQRPTGPGGFVGPPAPPETARLLPTTAEAYEWAYADLRANVPAGAYPYTRYLFIPGGERVNAQKVSLTLNLVSRGSAPVLPVRVADGHLVRYDTRAYAPTAKDQADWQRFLEDFRFDPQFSRLLTRKTLRLYGVEERDLPPVVVKEVKEEWVTVYGPARTETKNVQHPGGTFFYHDDSPRPPVVLPAGPYRVTYWYRGKPVSAKRQATVVERLASPFEGHEVFADDPKDINPAVLSVLRQATRTAAPVVDYRYFLFRALSSIQEKNAYADVWGGRYYELAGIETAEQRLGKGARVNGRRVTDEDVLFDDLGLGSLKAGETAEQFFDRLRSGQRMAMTKSGVTGKPREADLFETAAASDGRSSAGSVTGDIADEDVTEGEHPLINLLRPFRRAREWIVPKRFNYRFVLTKATDGSLQREVPPSIAAARNHPAPHTTRLQPAIDCLDCHGVHDMWIPAPNSVKALLRSGVDILGDQAGGGYLGDPDTIDRLRGLFTGDDRDFAERVRDAAAKRFLAMTGPFEGADPTQSDIVRVATKALCDDYKAYWYGDVAPKAALFDLGYDVPEKAAPRLFRLLLPPDRQGSSDDTPELGRVTYEDPRLAAIAAGEPVRRQDWALVRSFAAERAGRTVQPFGGRKAWLEKFSRN